MRNNLNVIPEIPSSENIINSTRGNIIYVEGKNDEEIFRNIIKNGWQVQKFGRGNADRGKQNIINYFSTRTVLLNKIAIVDKDYDNNRQISNVYYTDYNDIENTAINLMEEYEIIKCLDLKEFFNDKSFKSVYEPVKQLANKFSNLWQFKCDHNIRYLKYITNEENSNELLEQIANFELCTINYNKLYEHYEEYFTNSSTLQQIMEPRIQLNSNSFRGHDFFYFLKEHLKRKYNLLLNDNIENKFIKDSTKYNWIKRSQIYRDINNKYNCFKSDDIIQ